MIRRWFSNFFKMNKGKFRDLGVKLIIVAIVVFIATIILSFNLENKNNINNKKQEVYNPKQTVIKGKNVLEEQYKVDETIIDKFVNYCNNKQFEEAYALISSDCKNKEYESLDIFKKNYCEEVFNEKREYNIQSWISTNKYTIYKIRYTKDILSTGSYDKNEAYNDYITLLKKQDREELSIGSFVQAEECNIETEQDGIKVNVEKKATYIEDEEYEICVTNNTENTILLDTLESSNNIKLVTEIGNTHQTYINAIQRSKLLLNVGETKNLTLKFKKTVTNSSKSKYIGFLKVIKNYEKYIEQKENYTDTVELKIKL